MDKWTTHLPFVMFGRNPTLGENAMLGEKLTALAGALLMGGLFAGCGGNEPSTEPIEDTGVVEPDVEPDVDRPVCETACQSVGQQICVSDTSFATCFLPEGDFCFDLVAEASCGEGSVCLDGECGDPPCEDRCAIDGAAICTENNRGFVVCADYDDDGCLEFGEPVMCSGRELCSGSSCPVACETSECDTAGERTCGAGGVMECGDFDRDGCLEWGPATSCPAGQSCSAGVCSEAGTCLLISEYVEGASQEKGIELYNCGASINMEDIGICLVANGDTSDCTHVALFTGSMSGGQLMTICHPSAHIRGCDVEDDAMGFNGDDRLVVFLDENHNGMFDPRSDTVLDGFGEYDWAPSGRPWEDVNYRRCNPEPFDGTSRFEVEDYFTRHSMEDLSNFGIPPVLDGCR